MTTDLLALTQWLSPAFPLGSFAYSHGLETAITDGAIHDAASLEAWLNTIIARGSGWNDALLLAAALRGEPVADLAGALTGSAERLEETLAQGTAFATTLSALGHALEPAPLPVVVGQAASTLSLPPETILGVYLQSFASNLVQCAVRFVPLGQSEGQGVLARLAPAISATADKAKAATLDDLGSGAFLGDLAAMRHEHQTARVFRT